MFVYEISIPDEDVEDSASVMKTTSERMAKVAEQYGWNVKKEILFPESSLLSKIETMEAGIGKTFFCVTFTGGVVTKVSEISDSFMLWFAEAFGKITTKDFQSFVTVAATTAEDAVRLACKIVSDSEESQITLKPL